MSTKGIGYFLLYNIIYSNVGSVSINDEGRGEAGTIK